MSSDYRPTAQPSSLGQPRPEPAIGAGLGREFGVVLGLRWWVGAARVVHVFEAVLADLERAVDAVVVGCDPDLITASCAMELVGGWIGWNAGWRV